MKLELPQSPIQDKLLLKESHQTTSLMEQSMEISSYSEDKLGKLKREHLYRQFRKLLSNPLPLIALVVLLPLLGTSGRRTPSQLLEEHSHSQQDLTSPLEMLPTEMTSKSSLPQEPMQGHRTQ